MDVLLKNYFWVIHLAVIGVCAGLAGRAGSHLIEQAVLGVETLPAAPLRPPSFATPDEAARSKQIDAITDRNVFCSACAPVKPQDESPETVDRTPQRSSLQLELVSTMVVPEDERWSMAVIRDLSSKERDPNLYARGSSVPGGATIERVIEKRVYLKNGNRIEYLELDGAAPLPTASAPPAPTFTPPGGEGGGDDIGNRVRCNGAQCEIERSLIDQLLSNTTALATSARFVPSIKDGRPNGFKLFAIRPGSIFSRIGLQNGDTIKSINGLEMNTPDQALGVYTKVRNASHLTVTADRRGETVTYDYTIR